MAFLSGPVRWPDILGLSTVSSEAYVKSLRSHLPGPLAALPSSLLLSVSLSIALIITLSLFSAYLNQRRTSLVPEKPHAVSAAPKKRSGPTKTLLIGPEQTGKSSLYSALVFDAVPATQTSQHENESKIVIKTGGEFDESINIHLVDLPGHPRLRAKSNEHLAKADQIVFCVDTASAIKGGMSKNETLVEAVDLLHSTLTQLARQRLSRSARKTSSPPPSLLMLFTRSDLSPLIASNPNDPKRQATVISRARNAFEAELGRRRAGMGLGAARGSRAKVGGMAKVVGAENRGWLETIKSLFGFGSTRSSLAAGAEEDEEDEEDEEGLDYLDWEWAQRQQQKATSEGSGGASSTSFSLDRLEGEVIAGGKASFAVATVGKERGWGDANGTAEATNKWEGLTGLKEWIGGNA